MRLFIAINPPGAMRQRLWNETAPLREVGYPVKWVDAGNIHMTVKFLGDADGSRIDDVRAGLVKAVGDTKAFCLSIGQFGAFPSPKRPRVLWVGCENLPVLELLADAVEREMLQLGFEPEKGGHAFRPHVTIGRVRRDARPAALTGLARHLQGLEFFEELPVDSVDLMRSRLGSQGPRYERLGAAGLSR
jgi:RNA 2',3'-cyclic 3'-phosphodiesterase